MININNQKTLMIKIKENIIDLNLYDFSFLSYESCNQISIINKISSQTFYINFKLPDEGKEYEITRNNIIYLLNPIDLSKKIDRKEKDKDDYMSM